jgi:phosphoribosylglycinamide formyltransferase 1
VSTRSPAPARQPLRLAILISGRGSNMATIARACQQHRIAATVPVVISDRPGVAGITTAQELGIQTQIVPWKAAPDRAAFELALGECIDAHEPDLIVLAGFMRVLSGPFVDRYAGCMLNIHPSLLPKYTGLHTHRRALEAGDTVHGATVHFVTPELDGGPLILQSQVPIEAGDTESTLAARVQTTEHVIYPRVIEWIADGRLHWNEGHPVLDGKPLNNPVVEYFGAAT